MNSLRPAFLARGFDQAHWQRLMHRHPQEYIRRKLRTIHLYAQGQSPQQVADQLDLHLATSRRYLKQYITQGWPALTQPEKRAQPSRLTAQQQAAFKDILLQTRPVDHQLGGNIWTAALMRQYLLAHYGVNYRTGIYDLLERLGLSHQKAHADYGNADPLAQQASLEQLKATLLAADPQHAVLVYDEFSISEKPTSYYGWAEKNTRPRHVTNEKKVNA
jgi:transposase